MTVEISLNLPLTGDQARKLGGINARLVDQGTRTSGFKEDDVERYMTHPPCGWAHGRVSGDPGDHEGEARPHSASPEELPVPSAPRSLAG